MAVYSQPAVPRNCAHRFMKMRFKSLNHLHPYNESHQQRPQKATSSSQACKMRMRTS